MTLEGLISELLAAWTSGDALRASAFFAPDGVYTEPQSGSVYGREAILTYFLRFFREGPPWRLEIDETIAEGDRAAVKYRFFVQGPNGEWRERPGCAFVRRSGGLIAEWREYDG
jgi:predicted SnoaL-like aldol condensation-catalyzing enzyme